MPQFRRSFLLLQGICSPFFACLADRLVDMGHFVDKINFNGGDVAYWGNRLAWSYRGQIDGLAAFVEHKCITAGITDLVLFGDRRPVHRSALEVSGRLGIRVHVFEEGYFRPCWVTLERGGVNAHSLLPRNPDWYRHVAMANAQVVPPESFLAPFCVRAFHDVVYHLAGMANPLLFPGYRSHAPHWAPVMYGGYLLRMMRKPWHTRSDAETVARLIMSQTPYYVLPLQLNSDAQIRDHSEFSHMIEVMEYVMESFARHAPTTSHLVIKNHPLDMGLVPYSRAIKALEQRFDLVGRVAYLETGDLNMVVQHCQGVVTVNSTVGGVALQHLRPTITLSNPIYNLPGLTFQGELDHFWQDAVPPDAELFHCFKEVVIRTTQVNGGFYCQRGIELAVGNSVSRLCAERSPLEELL